jgi:hypothetical protein
VGIVEGFLIVLLFLMMVVGGGMFVVGICGLRMVFV